MSHGSERNPAPIKARRRDVAREAVATEEFRARTATLGLTPVGNSARRRENYDAFIRCKGSWSRCQCKADLMKGCLTHGASAVTGS